MHLEIHGKEYLVNFLVCVLALFAQHLRSLS